MTSFQDAPDEAMEDDEEMEVRFFHRTIAGFVKSKENTKHESSCLRTMYE